MTTDEKLIVECSSIISEVQKLLRPCLGPQGLSILVETEDGHSSFMHNALQLVTVLQYKAPSSGLVVEGVKQLYSALGDGGKKFILMLAAALHEIQQHCCGNWDVLKACGLALARLRSELFFTIIPAVTTSQVAVGRGLAQVVDEAMNADVTRTLARSLAEGVLRRGRSVAEAVKLLEAVSMLLFPPQTSHSILHLQVRTNWLLKNFEEVIVKIPGVPSSASCVWPGFVLDRRFLVAPSLPLTNFRCVLLLCGLSPGAEEDESSITYSISSQDHLSEVRRSSIRYKEKIVQALVDHEIKLVLTACKVDTISAHCLQASSIGAIQLVPEETLRFMAESCGQQLITETREMLNMTTSWVSGLRCSYRTVCHTRRVIHIEMSPPQVPPDTPDTPLPTYCQQGTGSCRNSQDEDCLSSEPEVAVGNSHDYHITDMVKPWTVIVGGATIGQCKRLASLLLQVLRTLSSWVNHQDENGCYVVVRGGGAWEIGVARELERKLQDLTLAKRDENWIIYKALQRAFLATPLCLLENSNPRTSGNTMSCQLLHDLLKSDVALGVNTEKGVLVNVDSTSDAGQALPWEPYWSQLVLVQSVFDFLVKCLRTDGVLRTKTPIASLTQSVEEDDDE